MKKGGKKKRKTTYVPKYVKKISMAAIHTEAAATFNGQLINKAEDKIQYVKYRPSQPFL